MSPSSSATHSSASAARAPASSRTAAYGLWGWTRPSLRYAWTVSRPTAARSAGSAGSASLTVGSPGSDTGGGAAVQRGRETRQHGEQREQEVGTAFRRLGEADRGPGRSHADREVDVERAQIGRGVARARRRPGVLAVAARPDERLSEVGDPCFDLLGGDEVSLQNHQRRERRAVVLAVDEHAGAG